MTKKEIRKRLLLKSLEKSLGDVSAACKFVGVARNTFYEYCKSDSNFKQAVLNIQIPKDLQILQKNKSESIEKKFKDKKGKGYIYIIQYGADDIYKIGISKNDPYNRLSCMQTGTPTELILIGTYFVKHYRKEEYILHEYLKPKAVRGEWFKLSKSELNDLISRLEIMEDLENSEKDLFSQ